MLNIPLAVLTCYYLKQWHLWIDNYTKGSGYMPFETYNIAGGQWSRTQSYKLPANPRHGYVIPM